MANDRADAAQRPEHLGPMARSIVDTFSSLTLAQQRRVLSMLTDLVTEQEAMERLLSAHEPSDNVSPAADTR